MVRLAEKPLIRTAPAPMYRLSSLIRETGMKVVLMTGEGADEVFAGYDLFKEAQVRRFCARQPGSKFRPHLFRKLYPYLPGLQKQSAEYLAAFFGADAAPLSDPLFSHRPRLRGTAAPSCSSPPISRANWPVTSGRRHDRAIAGALRRWHPLHQAQYLETRFLMPGYILSSQGDRMAMGNGVEGRFPFLDHRLVEFATTLSPSMKLKGLKEKYLLRKSMADKLPAEITHRVKQPYRAPDSRAFSGAVARRSRSMPS